MAKNEEILRELTRRVQQRRQEGRYPMGLEQQLSSEFDAILSVVHRGDDTISQIHAVIQTLTNEVVDVRGETATRSRRLGGRLIHVLVRKLSRRHTQRAFELTIESLELVVKQLIQQRETDSRVMKQIEHVVMDRILMVDVLAEAVLELERKVGPGT